MLPDERGGMFYDFTYSDDTKSHWYLHSTKHSADNNVELYKPFSEKYACYNPNIHLPIDAKSKLKTQNKNPDIVTSDVYLPFPVDYIDLENVSVMDRPEMQKRAGVEPVYIKGIPRKFCNGMSYAGIKFISASQKTSDNEGKYDLLLINKFDNITKNFTRERHVKGSDKFLSDFLPNSVMENPYMFSERVWWLPNGKFYGEDTGEEMVMIDETDRKVQALHGVGGKATDYFYSLMSNESFADWGNFAQAWDPIEKHFLFKNKKQIVNDEEQLVYWTNPEASSKKSSDIDPLKQQRMERKEEPPSSGGNKTRKNKRRRTQKIRIKVKKYPYKTCNKKRSRRKH